MDTESLIYKEHLVRNNDVEIIFHTDVPYIFNETTSFPVVKFTLINCRNPLDINFDTIDYYNDGIIIDIAKENEQSIFCMTDMGGDETKIFCDIVKREDLEYRQSDLIDLIKATKKESDENDKRANMFNDRILSLTTTLEHDLDIIQRKLEQANWLTTEKKEFLEGQKSTIHQVLEFIDKKQKEDSQKGKPNKI
ncbi:MAG: hypothetical protein ABIP10_16945 [Ferruginibacter sp.]